MFNWIDVSIAVIFIGIGALEAKRGFGRALFDTAAALVALRAAFELNRPLARAVHLSADPYMNQAAVYAICFAALAAVLLYLGKLLYDITLVTAGVFDPVLGGMCGLAIAVIASHALVRTIALGSGGGDAVPAAIGASVFGMELLRFDTYHQVLEFLYNFHREPVG